MNENAAGWYGKIPALGDFAARRLPHEFVHAWDDWLQHGLAAAYETLAQTWPPPHELPPIRRFWLGRGVIGTTCWAGLLLPSADRVGRHFPLTIAVPAPASTQAHSLARVLHARAWFDAVDALARRVLDAGLGVEDFESALGETGELPADDGAADDGAADSGASDDGASDDGSADAPTERMHAADLRTACVLLQGFVPATRRRGVDGRRAAAPPDPAQDIDVHGAADALPCSVWWCSGATEPAQFLCYGALPPASELAPLLTGDDCGAQRGR